MIGLFGTLNLGSRALAAQQQGVQTAGHNLANVNNPAYARQRLNLQTSTAIADTAGFYGTGVEAGSVVSLRNNVVDREMIDEASVTGSLDAQQSALQDAQTNLGGQIDQTAGAAGIGGSHSLADGLSNFFNGFQTVSADATASDSRKSLVGRAVQLANQFNQMDRRLSALNDSLNTSAQSDVAKVNTILSEIAGLNGQISKLESGTDNPANDLRDLRQQKLEELAHLVKIDSSTDDHGNLNVAISGSLLVAGPELQDTLSTYDPGDGQLQIRTASAGTNLTLTGGSLHGTLATRDGAVASLRSEINTLAQALISGVNALHSGGYDLSGNSGLDFFTGTTAADIQVNSTLVADPKRFQAASAPGAAGNNGVVLSLAQLATQPIPALGNQTFNQSYSNTVSALGGALSAVNRQQGDQTVITSMLTQQRNSVSGVSLDEELTDLTRFQKAFTASARLITTVDEMLDTVINLKRG